MRPENVHFCIIRSRLISSLHPAIADISDSVTIDDIVCLTKCLYYYYNSHLNVIIT